MSDQLLTVPFHGDNLVLIDHNGEPFVAMRTIVTNMGLGWGAQYIRIMERFGGTVSDNETVGGATVSDNETVHGGTVLDNRTVEGGTVGEITIVGGATVGDRPTAKGATVRIIMTVAEDGKLRPILCLALRKLPAWLYSINPNKVAPNLRDKIIRYQEECDEVLWNYWTKGYAGNPKGKAANQTKLFAAQNQVIKLVKELKKETIPSVREALYAALKENCQLADIPVPILAELGRAHVPDPVPNLVAEFWEAYEFLNGAETLNHSTDRRYIAINLPHFVQVAAEAKLKVPPMLEFRRVLRLSENPKYLEIAPKHSAIHARHNADHPDTRKPSTVRCWVFQCLEDDLLGHE